ncbi:uncharacterized protein LOC144872295 [Branchiostoma floridae x Branchiostoma japonicum]
MDMSPVPSREWLWLVVGSLLLALAIAVISFTLSRRMRKAKEKKNRRRAMEMSRRPLPPVPPVPPRATARSGGGNNSGRREEAEYDLPPAEDRTGYDVRPNSTGDGYDVPPHTYDRRLGPPSVVPDPAASTATYNRSVLGQGPSCYRPDSGVQPPLPSRGYDDPPLPSRVQAPIASSVQPAIPSSVLPPIPSRTFDTYGIHDRPSCDTVVFDTYCIDQLACRSSFFSRT